MDGACYFPCDNNLTLYSTLVSGTDSKSCLSICLSGHPSGWLACWMAGELFAKLICCLKVVSFLCKQMCKWRQIRPGFLYLGLKHPDTGTHARDHQSGSFLCTLRLFLWNYSFVSTQVLVTLLIQWIIDPKSFTPKDTGRSIANYHRLYQTFITTTNKNEYEFFSLELHIW